MVENILSSNPSADLHPIHWVQDAAELATLCERWLTLPFIAVDTEFIRTSTYYPIPALIQVFDGQANYLIDPTAIEALSAFAEVLAAPTVIKVFHACSEDIEVFSHLLAVTPAPVIDTQLAAAVLGYGYSKGFAKLVSALLGVELGKEQTRSDWLQRPLSEAQRDYAASDVEYLHRVYLILEQSLRQQGRFEWVQEDSKRLVSQSESIQPPELAYTRYKGAWRLKPRNLALLQKLAKWREELAQSKDLPRSRVVDNKSLYTIAERLPKSMAQLRGIESLHDAAIRRYGKSVLDAVHHVMALTPGELPEPIPRPPSSELQKQMKRLREAVDAEAERLNLAPELLATRRDLEEVITLVNTEDDNQLLSQQLSGWRAPILERVVNQFLAKQPDNSSPQDPD